MSASSAWVAGLIFLLTFAVIMTDRVHRTIVAWVGATMMIAAGLLLGFYSQTQALAAIDFNTLGLLLAMMMLVAMLGKTGVFEYLAILAAQRSGGDPWRLLLLLGGLTAILSMFLDNVTTIVLIAPVTLLLAEMMAISPVPLLMGEALLSNIGGTATLVGDPPNILIGSAAGFSFNDFLPILLPIVLIAYYPTVLALRWVFRDALRQASDRLDTLQALCPKDSIKDRPMMNKVLVALGVVIVLFFLHDALHLKPAYVAFAGVAIALVWVRPHPEDILKEVEWSVLLFFACLFIAVGGLEAAGVMNAAAELIVAFAGTHLLLTAVLLIWVAALLSAIVDNIPFAVAMVPVIKGLEAKGVLVDPLWWALALGVGFGGNGSPIGATANVIAITVSERAGYPITFRMWLRSGSLATVVSCLVGTLVFVLIFGVIKR
jgi:Na+/H+ antiporter NhaD/arsenite permease-like protein